MTTTRVRRRKRSPWKRLWRRLRYPLLGLAAVLALVALDLLIRYLPAVRALEDGRSAVVQARALLTGDLAHLDRGRVDQARALLRRSSDDFGSKSSILADGWLAGLAGHLPGLSGQVEAAGALRTAGAAGSQFALDVTALAEQVTPAAGSTDSRSTFQRVVGIASSNQDALAASVQDLRAFRQAMAAIPSGPLLGPLDRARTTLLTEGGRVADSAGPAISIFQALPAAAGQGNHAYLLLLGNPGEERPGGGFIGAVGEVDVSNGAITGETFQGSEFAVPLVRDIPAPRPLNDYLFHNAPWELSDANWSPDFPTASTQVEKFYKKATGRSVDGVFCIDPVALGEVLRVLGPIRVASYPQTITPDNALMELNYITNKARPGDPGKAFLPPFGRTMLDGLLHAPLAQLPGLANALQQGAREKHVVLYFHDAQLQQLVDAAGYSGRLGAPLSDSLLVDDANLSGTKGDLFVTRRFAFTAQVGNDGTVKDELTLTYRNPRVTDQAGASMVTNSGGDYRDYLRVYVPETAQLHRIRVSINGAESVDVAPEAVTYDQEREGIGLFVVVPRGGSLVVILDYTGPFADVSQPAETYSLLWQKQINALTWPIDVTITMPDGRTRHATSELTTDRTCTIG